MTPQHIRIKDFTYDLPDERIAKFPVSGRDGSKLLIYRGEGRISQDLFSGITAYLPKGELMVMNNTKVIQARMRFQKHTGAQIEIFCLEPYLPADYAQNFQMRHSCQWLCMIGNLKKWLHKVHRDGTSPFEATEILSDRGVKAAYRGEHGSAHIVEFSWNEDITFAELLERVGELPIPPYLNRETQESDKITYQTVYSKIKGSVAAPTAGLHFTEQVLSEIDSAGIEREEVTLHVGAGTFKPVKSEEIGQHEMHSEYIVVSRRTINRLIAHGGRAIAVGTTSVRTLESLYYIGLKIHSNPDATEEQLHVRQWEPYEVSAAQVGDHGPGTMDLPVVDALQGIIDWLDRNHLQALHTSTQIIIAPGYRYHVVHWMITNFHQPQSTLLLLVSAFIGDDWRKVYDYALRNGFRFLSYGDSSLLMPQSI